MGLISNGVLTHKLASFVHTVSMYLLPFLSFISNYIFRPQQCGNSVQESKAEKYISEIIDNFDNYYAEENEKKSELHLKFNFPTYEQFSRIHKGKGTNFLFNSEIVPYASTSKYEFSSSGNKVIVGFGGGQNGKTKEDDQEFVDISKFCCEEKNYSHEFLSDGDFRDIVDSKFEKIEFESEFPRFKKNQELPAHNIAGGEGGEFRPGDHKYYVDKLNLDFLRGEDFFSNLENGNENSKKSNLDQSNNDVNKLESLWEHQELIDQLKMELRKVRDTGLPTILEESESPKITENLKTTWEIEEEFDCIGSELHKSYQSYTQMMRKLDILNYQKMYAMGFLQLKDPFQSITPHQKPLAPTLKSLVSQNLWLFKHKSHGSCDPIKKFINELQSELEVIYIGQMCSSWEFLRLQYDKALDLWNSDPNGMIHRYNEVAGEFQQFRVLVERFVEDEPFQGPRVQNYVKSRCVLRNLLQVPIIREDFLKNKNNARKNDHRDEYGVTSEMLMEMVEESIEIFGRFVRSDDKGCTSLVSINCYKRLPELNNPDDLKLLLEVRRILQKKEKKLKDLLRSEKCILRKFRPIRENDTDQSHHFFAQLDMKLVSRVCKMSKITRDQLIWCRNKLSRINFVNWKIYIEPGFLLFPCN